MELLLNNYIVLADIQAAIQRQLSNQPYQDIDIIDKPEGNLRRYPVGTIADIPSDETTHLFLWALSTFNRELKAQTLSLIHISEPTRPY